MKIFDDNKHRINQLAVALLLGILFGFLMSLPARAVTNPQGGTVGLEGKISAPPPTQAARITLPTDGAQYTALPLTVTGLCTEGLTVKLFKNNVFAGAADCKNGSFSIVIDLFSGRNELVARVFDSLDQAGPDSNTIAVVFNDTVGTVAPKVSLTSNYAKRGATPGTPLTWPVILSGGTGPYAISVDWGDGKPIDLQSRQFAGTFDIKHTYESPGVYNILIKATDINGTVAYLQLVGVGNGPLSQDNQQAGNTAGTPTGSTLGKYQVLWQPAIFLVPFLFVTFWLGKRHELHMIRKKLETGDRPF